MSLLDALRHRLHVLRRGDEYGSEVERELRFHAELDALARDGRGAAVDEIAARRVLGNTTYHREETRRMTPLQSLDRIRQDLGYAWRGLRRTPAFTLTVVVTLGLGLGVNAAMYSFLDRLFVRNPARVVAPDGVKRLYVNSARAVTARGGHYYGSFNYPLFQGIRARVDSSIRIALFTPSDSIQLTVGSRLASSRESYATPDFFRVLRLRPQLGRLFAEDESAVDGHNPVAVVSDALWRRELGADPSILGRVLVIKNKPFTIVGVAPAGFAGIDANLAEVWLPLSEFPEEPSNGHAWYAGTGNYLRAIARVDSASQLTRLIAAGTAGMRHSDGPQPDTTTALVTGPIIEARGPAEQAQEISLSTRLAGVAALVLLIACANIANLLLLRAASRRRELAIRRALGVSRARLWEQLLTESVLLALLSGGAAVLFATWGAAALRRLLLPRVHWAAAPMDLRLVGVTLVVTLCVGVLAGLLPAIGATRPELTDALRAGARDRSHHSSRMQAVLLVAQTALSVVLLVGAGLLVRTLDNVRSIDIGYESDGVMLVNTYLTPERGRVIGAELVDMLPRLRAIPGVVEVAASTVGPMTGYAISPVFLPGRDSAVKVLGRFPTNNVISSSFIKATGMRLVAGRDFAASDAAGSASVAMVNETMARALWPGETPIGKCIAIRQPTAPCRQVVGVVGDAHRGNIIEEASGQFFLPLAQQTDPRVGAIALRVVHSQFASVATAVRAELSRIMPDASDFSVRSMDQVLEPQLRPWRMGAILFSALGLLALIVASVGIYGVMAYSITQRTQEMGVRLALGAQASDVLNLVLGDGLRVVIVGIAIGLVVALSLGRLVSSLLFGVVPNDPSVLILAVVTLATLAAVACLIPGWRATRVDPMTALRSD